MTGWNGAQRGIAARDKESHWISIPISHSVITFDGVVLCLRDCVYIIFGQFVCLSNVSCTFSLCNTACDMFQNACLLLLQLVAFVKFALPGYIMVMPSNAELLFV